MVTVRTKRLIRGILLGGTFVTLFSMLFSKKNVMLSKKYSTSEIYAEKCAVCHRSDLAGSLGPNLVDNFWINGNSLQQIKNSIAVGHQKKEIPAFKDQLSDEQIEELAKFIVSKQGTQSSDAKAPQGFGH